MTYSERGLGGERLNANDLNYLMNGYLMKAYASFSNKMRVFQDTLIVNKTGLIHFLFESTERKSFYSTGEAHPGNTETWDSGRPVPSDIQDIDLVCGTGGASVSKTVRNRADNLSSPILLSTKNFDTYYVQYWYTYAIVSIDLTTKDANDIYIFKNALDSSSADITGWDLTTLRVSYGQINTINTPVPAQNQDFTVNISSVLHYAFLDNTLILLPPFLDKISRSIEIDSLTRASGIQIFKLFLINDNSSQSGVTSKYSNVLIELNHDIISLGGGKYLHQLTFGDNLADNLGDEEVLNHLEFSNSYFYYQMCIVLPNSQAEFGFGSPKFLDNIDDGTPLTNILLSYMNNILKYPIYSYSPQNYMTVMSWTVVYFKNTELSPYRFAIQYTEGAVNTHLTMVGAYSHLFDLTLVNDGQELSWDVIFME